MLFNSNVFLFIFLPVVLAGFHLLRGRSNARWAMGWLAGASLAFYGYWDPRYLPLLLGSITANYLLSRAIRPGGHRSILIAGLAFNLGLLAFFKYANFFVANVGTLTGTEIAMRQIVLPIGISFFTFTQIAFLVDRFQGKAAQPGVINYALFATFFPHLIAGPILHHKEMMSQFESPEARRWQGGAFNAGLFLLAVGLVKKMVIADSVGGFAAQRFARAAAGEHLEAMVAWLTALAYHLQIYFDFSAYCEMAMGISLLFGIRFPANFDSPYQSRSIIDFWRRWHMTLSRFLRDYLYVPLGGSRRSRPRRYVNLMITMLLGGLWHGAAWTYVAWGGLHGFYLVVNHAWEYLRKKIAPNARPAGRFVRALSVLLTFAAVTVAWVLFRANSFASAMRIISGMAGLNGIDLPAKAASLKTLAANIGMAPVSQTPYISNTAILGLLLLLTMCWLAPNAYQIMGAKNPALNAVEPGARWTWRPSLGWAVGLGVLGAVAFTGILTGPPSEFLYFQF